MGWWLCNLDLPCRAVPDFIHLAETSPIDSKTHPHKFIIIQDRLTGFCVAEGSYEQNPLRKDDLTLMADGHLQPLVKIESGLLKFV